MVGHMVGVLHIFLGTLSTYPPLINQIITKGWTEDEIRGTRVIVRRARRDDPVENECNMTPLLCYCLAAYYHTYSCN